MEKKRERKKPCRMQHTYMGHQCLLLRVVSDLCITQQYLNDFFFFFERHILMKIITHANNIQSAKLYTNNTSTYQSSPTLDVVITLQI